VNAHQVGEPLLRLTLVLRQVHEQPEMARAQPQGRQPVGEVLGASGTELRQQEPSPAGKRGSRWTLRCANHLTMVSGSDCHQE
jgi:hypothetical protein